MGRRVWPWAWAAWLTAVLGSFAVLEWAAYYRGTHLTLSRWLARHMGCQPRRPHGRYAPALFALAGVALGAHIARLRALPPG